jgi:thiamine biosynthesis lipoprotein ApbE
MTALLQTGHGPVTLVSRSVRAIGTVATVVVQDDRAAGPAERILRGRLDAIDRACSRFRSDSELQMVHAHAGRVVRVSPLLFEALEVARSVAVRTHGAVDPTVGNAIAALGSPPSGTTATWPTWSAGLPSLPRPWAGWRATCTWISTEPKERCVSRAECVSTSGRRPRRW